MPRSAHQQEKRFFPAIKGLRCESLSFQVSFLTLIMDDLVVLKSLLWLDIHKRISSCDAKANEKKTHCITAPTATKQVSQKTSSTKAGPPVPGLRAACDGFAPGLNVKAEPRARNHTHPHPVLHLLSPSATPH